MTKKIALVLYAKNNAEYLQDFLFSVLLKTLESQLPGYAFHYYFYENDSTDGTLEFMREFGANKNNITIMAEQSPDLGIPISEAKTGRDFGRIARIAAIRNRFLDKYRTELSGEYQYVWFLDTNIFICAEDIAAMLKIIEENRDVAMVTCNTLETIENTDILAEKYGAPPPSVIPFITTNHYYDTFAFVSMDDRSFYPNCTSRECKYSHCRAQPNIIPPRSKSTAPLLDVRSAWGGTVLLDATILKHEAVRWKTFAWSDSLAPCEHIYFCDMVRAFSGRRIVLAPKIVPFWIA